MELAVVPELMADVDEDELSMADVETDGLRRGCSQFRAMHLVRSYLRPSKLPTQLMRAGELCITDADGAGERDGYEEGDWRRRRTGDSDIERDRHARKSIALTMRAPDS
jgi:hypothetical protein